MERLILECSIRAALMIAATAVVLFVLRIRSAAARHVVWSGVMLLMMLLPVCVAWGPKASLPVASPLAPWDPPVIRVAHGVSVTIAPRAVAASPGGVRWTRQEWLAAIYLLGFATLLLRLAIGTARASALMRRARREHGQLTSAACAAPVTLGWLRPIVVLPQYWPAWPKSQLDAVMAHEQAHVQRRDPLFQWLALFNRAVFWFHPLAWWMERRISALAEEACDAAVLARGIDPRDYSEYLLDIARSVMGAGARVDLVAAAMPGSSLTPRIRKILTGTVATGVPGWRFAAAMALCASASGLFAAGSFQSQQSIVLQLPLFQLGAPPPPPPPPATAKIVVTDPEAGKNQAGPAPTEFEVVSVRSGGTGVAQITINPTLMTANACTLGALISYAYNVTARQLEGKAGALCCERYNISAKSPRPATEAQYQVMLQKLLKDPFGLAFHRETSEAPVYALTVGKKLKMNLAQPGKGRGIRPQPDSSSAGIHWTGYSVSMPELKQWAGSFLGREVVDRSGLQGIYDFDVVLTIDAGPGGPIVPSQLQEGFKRSFEDQLGLKLEPAREPEETFVIDRLEKPSQN
jgi:uncharacterized protein (TIGR03435 family)